MLFLIDYEGSRWCGGQSNVVVEAETEDDAIDKASNFMEETMRELFSDEYEDDYVENGEHDEDCAYAINSVSEFDETHPEWKYYIDPTQASFYPKVD